MNSVLRRFAAVGTLVTALDVAVFLAARVALHVPVLVAGIAAIAAAAPVSYGLNRVVTFGGDPYVRWVQRPATYVAIAAAGAVVDLAVLSLTAAVLHVGSGALSLLPVRGFGLAAGAVVRILSYRTVLFEHVRDTQSEKIERGAPPGELRLSVIVPAYNEEGQIAETVERIRAGLGSIAGDAEVIVVDDGSRDATAAQATAAGAVVVVLPGNRGKGAAVRAGVGVARGRVVAYTDADLSYGPEQLRGFFERVEEGWDMVVGSRAHVDTRTLVATRRLREVTGRVFNLMTYAVLLGRYRDTQCGLKAFRRDVAEVLFSRARLDRFAFDVELFHLAERYQLSLIEVPVTVAYSQRSTVRVGLDAARMVRDLLRVRWWAGRGVYDLSPAEAAVLER